MCLSYYTSSPLLFVVIWKTRTWKTAATAYISVRKFISVYFVKLCSTTFYVVSKWCFSYSHTATQHSPLLGMANIRRICMSGKQSWNFSSALEAVACLRQKGKKKLSKSSKHVFCQRRVNLNTVCRKMCCSYKKNQRSSWLNLWLVAFSDSTGNYCL